MENQKKISGKSYNNGAEKTTDPGLKQSRDQLQKIMDHSLDVICTINEEGRFVKLGAASQNTWGYLPEELTGRKCIELVHEEDIEKTKLAFLSIMNGSKTNHFENRCNKKNNEIVFITWSARWDHEDSLMYCVARDTTERKEAEEKVRVAKDRYDMVAKATNEAIWDWDILTSQLYWGEGFRTQFGFDPKDVTTLESWVNHIHPDDKERVARSVIDKVRTPGMLQWEEEYRFSKADGSYADVIDRGFIIRDAQGSSTRMLGAMQDITQKIKGDQALRDSEEKRRLIMNAALDAIVCIDTRGNITFWNPQAEKTFGWTSEEVQGRTLSETIIPQKFRERHNEGIKNYLKTGKGPVLNVLLELSAINKEQKEFPVELTILPIKQGSEEFFCAFIRDITHRKEAEKQLSLSKERYDLITRATNDVIYEWDVINNVNYWGEGYETLFGHTRTGDKMPTDTWIENLHPEEKEGLLATTMEAFKNKKTSLTRELRFRCADGSYKTVFDNLVILYDNDQPIKIMGAMQDITERKKNETAIKELNGKLNKRAEELAASNSELEQFAYVASHDLQEPLRMISSFLQLLQKKYSGLLDDTAAQYIGQAVSGSERMKRLILDLLEFSRVGTNLNKRAPTNMGDMMKQVLHIFTNKIEETNAIIKVPLLPVINANKMLITQLFQNLIGNAFKYNKASVPEIEIGYEEKEDAWQFCVKDNGIGIDPRYFDKVFVIFQRLHNKNQFSGTGIGLAICKKIVEKHNGHIWVESQLGKGSTFFFTIKK